MQQEGGLSVQDWEELEMMQRVLEVRVNFYEFLILSCLLYKLPYLFQQALSYEKTPTLCYTVPAFETFMASLMDLQTSELGAEFIIKAGIDKLEQYHRQALRTPAYLVSVGEWSSYEANTFLYDLLTVLNPYTKLEWFYENHSADFAAQVKIKLFEAVCVLTFVSLLY